MRISDWSSDVCSSDLAGAGEPDFQLVAVAAADRLLKHGQILVEALQGREHRVPVRKEDVPPHHRIARRDAGEVAETARRIFDDLALGHLFQLARGADDRIGDQVRQVARHREHQVMMRSEEHTSELQSLMRNSYAVFCLKKKTNTETQKH